MSFIPDPWSQDFRPSAPVTNDDGPIFDNSLVTNVTAQLGGSAHLPCKVLNVKQDDHPVRCPNFTLLVPTASRI